MDFLEELDSGSGFILLPGTVLSGTGRIAWGRAKGARQKAERSGEAPPGHFREKGEA